MTGVQTYEGPWEIEIDADTSLVSPNDDDCLGNVMFVIDFDADPPTVEGEGECTFSDDGLLSTLITMGLADSLGPYDGAVEGEMVSATVAEGSVPLDLLEGESFEINWAGELSGDATEFNGDISGDEVITAEIFPGVPISISVEYVVSFDTDLVVAE
jgi:hypothetical protein